MYGNKGFATRDAGAWLSAVWQTAGVSNWGPVVLGNSDIKTMRDIKPGVKAIVMTTSEAPMQSMGAFLAWANIGWEDIEIMPLGSTAQTGRFLQDGKGEIALGYNTSSYWYEVEASPFGLRWLELDPAADPEAAARFTAAYPWTGFGVAEGGVPTSEGVSMAETMVPYITRFDTDPELVYQIIKWADENFDRYKDGAPWCKNMTLDNLLILAEEFYEPIHDGAVRYLEEKGLWTTELEARRQYNVEQLTLWVDAYQNAIQMADDRDLKVDAESEEWQEFWENYRDSLELPLLVNFQGPGIEQPIHASYYEWWDSVKPGLR
jgi:hypothetical protein